MRASVMEEHIIKYSVELVNQLARNNVNVLEACPEMEKKLKQISGIAFKDTTCENYWLQQT